MRFFLWIFLLSFCLVSLGAAAPAPEERLWELRSQITAHWGGEAAAGQLRQLEEELRLESSLPAIPLAWTLPLFYAAWAASLLASLFWVLQGVARLNLGPGPWRIFLVLFLFFSALLAAQYRGLPRGVQVMSRAELRAGPGMSFPLRGELPLGALLRIKEERARWARIEAGELEGWTPMEGLKALP